MPDSIYDAAWIFFIYAVLGWCVEVAYFTINKGKFVNRGFLNGPWCPIYGCGMLLVVVLLYPLRENLLILFLGSMVVTSLLELFTGLVLNYVFHSRWWDYSDYPFNLKGYICLKFSLYWAFAGTFVIALVHPLLFALFSLIPKIIGRIFLCVLGTAFVTDAAFSLATVLKVNHRLKVLGDLSAGLRRISDDIGQNIFQGTENISEIAYDSRLLLSENIMEGRNEFETKYGERIKNWVDSHRKDLNKWEKEHQSEWTQMDDGYKSAFSKKIFGENRLMKAFPGWKSQNRNDILQKYRTYLTDKRTKKQGDRKVEEDDGADA